MQVRVIRISLQVREYKRFSTSLAAGISAAPVVSVVSDACSTGIVEVCCVQSVMLSTSIATIEKKQSQSTGQRQKMATTVGRQKDIRMNPNRGIFGEISRLTMASLYVCLLKMNDLVQVVLSGEELERCSSCVVRREKEKHGGQGSFL